MCSYILQFNYRLSIIVKDTSFLLLSFYGQSFLLLATVTIT